MKKILIFMLLTASLDSWSQGYLSILGEDTTTWYQAREAIDRIDNIVIETRTDTVINTRKYIKLDIQGIIENTKLYISEDTLIGKIWIYNLEDQIEYLVMDLSLAKGDTFKIINSDLDFNRDSISIVDSIYYVDGKKLIRLDYDIQIHGTNEKLTFIEEIGPNAGLLYQIESIEDNVPYSQFLLCVYKDGNRVFKKEGFTNESCIYDDDTNGFNQNFLNNNFQIYPNPVSNQLFISSLSFSKGILEVYNIDGMLVDRFKVFEKSQISILVSDYSAGLYFIVFKEEKVSKTIGKFIKY